VLKLLSGSGLLLKAQLIMAAAEALWRDIQPVISTAKQQGLCPADMFSRADITWATGICLSRTVRLDDRGGQVVLCPFADLFNHSCDSKAFLLWDPKQQAVVLKADRPYKPGEEVCSGLSILHQQHLPPGTPADSTFMTCWQSVAVRRSRHSPPVRPPVYCAVPCNQQEPKRASGAVLLHR
jgi:hypothetical protein